MTSTLQELSHHLKTAGLDAWVRGEACIQKLRFHSDACEPGALFVALPGAQRDGHQFISRALSRNASAVLVSMQWWNQWGHAYADTAALIVADTWVSLKALAKAQRNMRKALRIAITGSNGKTTVKEMLAGILQYHAPSYATPGNYNTTPALSAAMFDIEPVVEFAIFELGINEKGEMQELADLVCPHVAAITNIGMAHSGQLGDRASIAREKTQVFSCRDSLRTAIVPEDVTSFLPEDLPPALVFHGTKSTPGLQSLHEGDFEFTEGTIHTCLFAEKDIYNALVAIRIAQVLSVPFPLIQQGLSSFVPLRGRGKISHGPVTVVEDWYNASPESMIAALQSFSLLKNERGRKIAILGGMEELGEFAFQAHRSVLDQLSASDIDCCLLIGEAYQEVMSGEPAWVHYAHSQKDLLQQVGSQIQVGDLVLIKGSRRFALEHIAERLLQNFGGTDAA